MKRTAFAIDLDRTLVPAAAKDLSETTLKVLREITDRGHLLIVATGRNYDLTASLFRNLERDCYVLSSFGALIRRFPSGEFLASYEIPPKIAATLYEEGRSSNYLVAKTFGRKLHEEFKVTHGRDDLNEVFVRAVLQNENLDHKSYLCSENIDLSQSIRIDWVGQVSESLPLQQKAKNLVEEFARHECPMDVSFFTDQARNLFVANFASAMVNKGNAVRAILKMESMSVGDLYAFGDNEKDLPMLEIAAFPCIVRDHTLNEIPKRSLILESAENEGVTRFLSQWLTDETSAARLSGSL